jgi:arylsulfatase A-like enzyme
MIGAVLPALLLGLLVGCTPPSAPSAPPTLAAAPERPDIVLILLDDLGWADLGCYGSTFHETPHIDALAGAGARFTNAYANAPNCAPTRACLMSGQYTPRHGVYTVNSSARGKTANRKLVPTRNTTVLADAIVTLPERLRDAGYATAAIGKWHLGDDPTTHGFDVNVGGTRLGHPKSYFSPYRNPTLPDGPEGEYLTDRLTDEAIRFIEDADRPYFLYLSHFAVHTPVQAKEDMTERYERKRAAGAGRGHAVYAAMVESVDDGVGRLLEAIERRGRADDTVVVLFSDNGGHARFTSMAPLRGSKGMLYEGGVREPLIVRWTGRVTAGTEHAAPVIGLDLYPTILEMAGANAPDDAVLDGVSLVPALTGTGDVPERDLYWHFPAYLEGYRRNETWRTTPAGAIRSGDLKLIEFFEDDRRELYDLSTDIGETTNLAHTRPADAERLHERLKTWRRAMGAPDLVPNPEYASSD